MVQQMMEKFNEYGPANTDTGLLNCDKQHLSLKKTALRDLQNDNGAVVPRSSGNVYFVKNRGSLAENSKLSGTKKPTPECPQSVPYHQSPIGSGANRHLVYARRKSDQELVKSNLINMDKNTSSPQQEQETPHQRTQTEGPKHSSLSAFTPFPRISPVTTSSGGPSVPHVVKPHNDLPTTEPNCHSNTPGVSLPVNSQGTSEQYWKERYHRLQTQLENCDHASQEEYIHMLRSLSSAGRSKHAVELEKRAIQLSLEEGHELQRMKILNVLGKSVSKDSESSPAQKLQLEK